MKPLVVDAIAPEGLAYLREHGFEIDQLMKPSLPTLYERVGDYEALVTRSGTAVTPELLEHAPRLRIVGRAGVGVDNIDVEACSRRGIVVVNAPVGNVVSAAEHTVGMMLALVRRIPDAHDLLKAMKWDRGIYGTELFRKTIGVVGLGKVGSRVAARLRGFDARVLVHDPYIPESRARDFGAQLTEFDRLVRECDVITFHVPLTDETENMMTARELAITKRGVRLVNCARGGIINEADLLAALESGQVAGAAIDVWTEEPPKSDGVRRPVAHPAVVATPHLGANSAEAQANVALEGGVAGTTAAEGERHGYGSLLTVVTDTGEGRKIIAGTVFFGQPRIVRLRDLNIEFTPEGYILVLSYEDRPGMVGRIGTMLGGLGVNIASMHVGRKSKRGRAIVVLILDEELSPRQLAEVARTVEADFARLIQLV